MFVCVCTVYVSVCVSLYQCSSIGVQKNTCNYKITKSIIFFQNWLNATNFNFELYQNLNINSKKLWFIFGHP